MSINIGGALLRVLGSADRKPGEPNPASKSDALDIIDTIMESKEMRARCGALSNLSSDVPVEARKQACRALLILMNALRHPQAEPPTRADGKVDYSAFRSTTDEFLSLAAPRPNGKWSVHYEIKYRTTAVPEFARVSPYVAELMEAFEALFGIRGALLVR